MGCLLPPDPTKMIPTHLKNKTARPSCGKQGIDGIAMDAYRAGETEHTEKAQRVPLAACATADRQAKRSTGKMDASDTEKPPAIGQGLLTTPGPDGSRWNLGG